MMNRIIFILALVLCFVTGAEAQQGAFRRNDTAATAINPTNLEPAIAAVDSNGRIFIRGAYAEDVAHVTGDFLVGVAAIRNDAGGTILTSNNGDYSGIAVNDRGVLLGNLIGTNDSNGYAVRLEDGALSDQSALVVVGAKRQNTIATDTGSDGDASNFKVDSVGALYITPGTQAATWSLGSIAATSLSGTYQTVITNSSLAKILDCYNKGDVDVFISTNASDNQIYIPSNTGKVLDLGPSGRHVATNISAKSVTGAAGTTGTLYCTVMS